MRKADLPTKACAACGRPFAWRKTWKRVWSEVRYCSDRCRANRGRRASIALTAAGQGCGTGRDADD